MRDEECLRERAIFTNLNNVVVETNNYTFDMIKGPTNKAILKLISNTLNFTGFSNYCLQLKEEMPIMLLRIINPAS